MAYARVEVPADVNGVPIPLLPVAYGASKEAAATTTATAAIVIHTGGSLPQLIRVWAFDTDLYYRTGDAGVSAPSAADAMVKANTYMDVPIPAKHTHIRFVARSGSGSYRFELLGA